MRLTIHIGPHKTGTTALQTAFAEGGRVLRRAGVLYPRCNWMFPAQHRLAFAMKGRAIPGTKDRPDWTVEVAELTATLERCQSDNVLISSEEFFSAPVDAIARLRDALATAQVTIIAFPRRPDSFLVSCYNQKVRQPGNAFNAPIRRFLEDPRRIAPEIDYMTCVGNWADVFGDGAIVLHPYEAESPLKTTLLHLGLGADVLTAADNVNRSLPGPVVEALRHAKLANMSKAKQKRVLALAAQVFADQPGFQLSNEARLKIIRHFEPDNDALFRRFGQTNPFTTAAFLPIPEVAAQNLNVRHMMQLVDHLI